MEVILKTLCRLVPEELIFFIILWINLGLDLLMIFRKLRPVKTSLHMMSCMKAEISCQKIIPSLYNIIGGLVMICTFESTMMMIGCIDGQK